MAVRSVLLQLARDSIQEVIEAQNTIDQALLLKEHPLLAQKIPTTLKIFIEEDLHGSCSFDDSRSLIENVILAAKKAAFEDKESNILTTSQYLHCSIEITLQTADGLISQKDEPIIK